MDFVADLFRNVGAAFIRWLSGFLPEWAVTLINDVLVAVILLLIGLNVVLFAIWYERKVIARMQDRLGPNRAGPAGLLQTPADAMKLLIKEDITPAGADWWTYNLAPVLSVFAAVMLLAVIPFGAGLIGEDLNVGVLYVVALGSVGSMAILMAGWGSNNKYALLGGFRVVAQLLSYEIPMVLAMLSAVLLAGTLSMQGIVQAQSGGRWFIFLMPTAFLIYLISAVAETGRSPFDLIEAESELVAGFHIEYSGMKFAWFFLAEFMNTFTLSAIATTLFLGGWQGPFVGNVPVLGVAYFVVKVLVVYTLFTWFRGTFPRVRIDQLMALAWKVLVPGALANLLLVALLVKLPLPLPVQSLVLFGANLALLLIGLGLIGRGLRLSVERRRMAAT
ncbi:MAG: NADH-quinone oxidoreductase subunit NuoH [Anaerolineae bacterium]|nr:NADH-quinone oxidoreductase subunit NuoH [Anaerolineae bacterium]MDW8099475.1 NADH-quinone oxidoreductase subunit NuoH [Anaerolineae bacterium]